jgi:hypothetical protein
MARSYGGVDDPVSTAPARSAAALPYVSYALLGIPIARRRRKQCGVACSRVRSRNRRCGAASGCLEGSAKVARSAVVTRGDSVLRLMAVGIP